MAGLSDRSPFYLSQRSADVVLSEIRPTKLAPEALRSVNVLLDELLWMILSTARSFATDQLKAALSKLLPTPLGKEALLEAEVELRAYWDRTSSPPSRPYTENSQEFPVQHAFELLRLKCEAYSTFNDTDDDTEAEKRWQMKVTSANGFAPHNVPYIAPAALYVTAILEHVCEHVLSNTGRVASRDSSRSTATVQDLFLALCEDESIYSLFRIMKVHNQIESQSNALTTRPSRNKSVQRSLSDLTSRPNGSPVGSASTLSGDVAKPRVSSDSTGSGTTVAALQSSGSRSSTEKSKAKKLFGRISVDKEGGSQGGHNSLEGAHKRSASILSHGRRGSGALDDGTGSGSNEVEFDELMRSGTTMKVSLTPDRLRTFEVYSKEKGRGVSKIAIPSSSAQQAPNKILLQGSPTINSPANTPLGQNMRNGPEPQKQPLQEQKINGTANTEELDSGPTRKQTKGAPPVSYDQSPLSRARSTSASQASVASNGAYHNGARKGSISALPVESVHSQSLRGVTSPIQMVKTSGSISSNTRTGLKGRRPVDLDSIDDILDGSSDEDIPAKKPVGRRRAPTVGGITSQTADLIDFLNSGPPEDPKPTSPTPTANSSFDKQLKRGRLRSIVSRLKGGQSMDKLSSQSSFDDFMGSKKPHGTPPPSFVPPPLSAKRSLHSLSSFSHSQVTLPKPPAPPVPTVTIPLSPPSSPSHSNGEISSTSPLRPRPSPTSLRKAVPAFTETTFGQHENGAISPIAPMSVDASPPTPSKVEIESSFMKAQQVKSLDDGGVSPTSFSVAHKASDTLSTPPPSFPSSARPSSKQAQRHALSPPSTPKIFASHASDLRRLMANATSADECRLLVDMFLAQSGLPLRDSDFPPDPKIISSVQQESAVVEALLGNGDARADEPEMQNGKNTSSSCDSEVPLTPRSDEHHESAIVYRKVASNDHTTQVIPVEA